MNLTVLYKKYKRLRYFAIVVIVSILGLIGFGYCDNISDKIDNVLLYTGTNYIDNRNYNTIFDYGDNGAGTYCINIIDSNLPSQYVNLGFSSNINSTPSNLYKLYKDQFGNWICLYGNKQYLNIYSYYENHSFTFKIFKLTDLLNTDITCPTCPECPNCSETESLLQSCNSDLQTCNSNLNYCMNGSFSGNSRSALFINNIQHLGAPIINIDIPEEFEWNYNYGSGEEIETMNIDIEGYGYDQEKMQKMVNTQFAEMNNEDLSNLISKIADFIPLLLIAGIFIRVRYIIKKRIFRK